MSGDGNSGSPPVGSRFRKGQSGNPGGRPKAKKAPVRSAFDVVFDRRLTFVHNGQIQQLTVEEALQQRTLENALAGDRPAQREILRMIKTRERWLAKNRPQDRSFTTRFEMEDPDNAEAALLLLGIAEPDESWGLSDYERLRLQLWAVQAALSRPGGRAFPPKDIEEIKRCTRDSNALRWPRGSGGR